MKWLQAVTLLQQSLLWLVSVRMQEVLTTFWMCLDAAYEAPTGTHGFYDAPADYKAYLELIGVKSRNSPFPYFQGRSQLLLCIVCILALHRASHVCICIYLHQPDDCFV